MFYSYEIEVAANTAETSPDITRALVTNGVITQVSFRPRPGHAGLCHCRVFYHDLQICPVDREEDLHGDMFPIEWSDHIELNSSPFELLIVAWNDDDTYPHTFDISFVVLPKSVLVPYSLSQVLTQFISLISPRRLFTGGGK